MADPVTLTIDDKQVTVPAGTLVVDAARAAGIEIPVFCSHPKLDPVGVCRMCLVEFVTPARQPPGRLLHGAGDRGHGGAHEHAGRCVSRARGRARLSADQPPARLPHLRQGRRVPAAGPDAAVRAGRQPVRRGEAPQAQALPDQRPDHAGPGALRAVLALHPLPGGVGRQAATRPVQARRPHGHRHLSRASRWTRKTSGSIIDICPVGALTDRTARFALPPLGAEEDAQHLHALPGGLQPAPGRARRTTLRRIVARENPAVNDEWICDKGRFLHQLRRPPRAAARRRWCARTAPCARPPGTRPWTASSTACGVGDRSRTAPTSVGGVAAAASATRRPTCSRSSSAPWSAPTTSTFPTGSAVRALPTGLPALADLGKSDLIVLVGLDPSESAPVLDLLIKRAVQRNRRQTADHQPAPHRGWRRYPGAYLPVRPGSEAVAAERPGSLRCWRRARARQRGRARQRRSVRHQRPGTDEWAWLRGLTPEQVAGRQRRAAGGAGGWRPSCWPRPSAPLFLYGPRRPPASAARPPWPRCTTWPGCWGRASAWPTSRRRPTARGCATWACCPMRCPAIGPLGDAGRARAAGQAVGRAAAGRAGPVLPSRWSTAACGRCASWAPTRPPTRRPPRRCASSTSWWCRTCS